MSRFTVVYTLEGRPPASMQCEDESLLGAENKFLNNLENVQGQKLTDLKTLVITKENHEPA